VLALGSHERDGAQAEQEHPIRPRRRTGGDPRGARHHQKEAAESHGVRVEANLAVGNVRHVSQEEQRRGRSRRMRAPQHYGERPEEGRRVQQAQPRISKVAPSRVAPASARATQASPSSDEM